MQPDMSALPLSDDPRQRAAQMAMIKVLSTPPEQILNLFERLEIPWERVKIDGESCFVVKWSDLMAGESRNQAEGPFIKKLMGEMKAEVNSVPNPPERFVEREREVKVERPAQQHKQTRPAEKGSST